MRIPNIEIDINNLEFSHSPLLNTLHKYEIENDLRLSSLLDIRNGMDLTRKFFEDMEWRAKNKHNILITLKGSRGCGKSTLAQGIKGLNDQLRGNKHSINDIVFSRKEYMETYKTAKPGQLFIIDEDFGFQTQTGAYRIHESMMLAEQTFRIEEVSTIACSVAPGSQHLYDYEFLVLDYDAAHGINRAVVFYPSQLSSGMFSRPAGYILFPSKYYIDKKIETQYFKKKKDFSTKVKKGLARTLQQDYDELTELMIKKFKWADDGNKPTEDVIKVYLNREYPQLANTEKEDIVRTIKVRMYEIHGTRREKKPD